MNGRGTELFLGEPGAPAARAAFNGRGTELFLGEPGAPAPGPFWMYWEQWMDGVKKFGRVLVFGLGE